MRTVKNLIFWLGGVDDFVPHCVTLYLKIIHLNAVH